MRNEEGPWLDDVLLPLAKINGKAHLSDIYKEVRQLRSSFDKKSREAQVRRTLEAYSWDSDHWHKVKPHRTDLFSNEDKGRGVWA